jgi:hypothetical protein
VHGVDVSILVPQVERAHEGAPTFKLRQVIAIAYPPDEVPSSPVERELCPRAAVQNEAAIWRGFNRTGGFGVVGR